MTATKDIDDIEAIKTLIQAFFDRVNENDPPGLQNLFVPNAHLTILRQDPPLPPPDSSAAASLPQPAHPAHSQTSADPKISLVYQSPIESFIKMLEDSERRKKPSDKPVPKVHEMPNLDATDVKVDGLFAQAWCPFTVTFDGLLHHYGYFSYTFGKTAEKSEYEGKVKGRGDKKRWRLEGLTQNYRRTPGWEGVGEGGVEFM